MKVKAFKQKPQDGKGWYRYIQLFTESRMTILEFDFVASRFWKFPKKERYTIDKGNYEIWDCTRYGWLFCTIAFASRDTYDVSIYYVVKFMNGQTKGVSMVVNECLSPNEVNIDEITDLVYNTIQSTYEEQVKNIVVISEEEYEQAFGNMPNEFSFNVREKNNKKVVDRIK